MVPTSRRNNQGAASPSWTEGSGARDPPKSAVRQGKVARRLRSFCTPAAAELLNHVQTLHLNQGLISLSLQAPRPRLQTSPATYQHAWTEQEGGLGAQEVRIEVTRETQEPRNQRHCGPRNDQHPESCNYQNRAFPSPWFNLHSLLRPSKPVLARLALHNSPMVPGYHLHPTAGLSALLSAF